LTTPLFDKLIQCTRKLTLTYNYIVLHYVMFSIQNVVLHLLMFHMQYYMNNYVMLKYKLYHII